MGWNLWHSSIDIFYHLLLSWFSWLKLPFVSLQKHNFEQHWKHAENFMKFCITHIFRKDLVSCRRLQHDLKKDIIAENPKFNTKLLSSKCSFCNECHYLTISKKLKIWGIDTITLVAISIYFGNKLFKINVRLVLS